MIFADYHTHTCYSHGVGTPEQIVQAAIKRGLSRVAISEHAPGHAAYGVRGSRLRALRREVDTLARRYGGQIEVLMGLECNLLGRGRSDAPPDRAPYDVLLLGFHKMILPRDAFVARRITEALGPGKSEPVATAEALLTAAEAGKIDMLSHPNLYVACDIPTLAKGAAQLGLLLELNSARIHLSCAQIQEAAALGARFIIGSDAHSPERVGDFALALDCAEGAGVLDRVENYREG